MFCEKCGRPIDEDDKVCPLCHEPVRINKDHSAENNKSTEVYRSAENNVFTSPVPHENVYEAAEVQNNIKSRFTAGFLQIFLGGLGVGRFYMGYSEIGILQIVTSLFTCGVGGFVWGFIDGLKILGGCPEKDASGNVLK